jgi:hypothetical protein
MVVPVGATLFGRQARRFQMTATITRTDQRWAILDPAVDPEDDLEYLRAVVEWHFSEETGSPFWLSRAKTLGFDPLRDIRTFDDLRQFPNVADELRNVPVKDLIPRGYGPNPPAPQVFESGGATGAPKRTILMPDWIEAVVDRTLRGPQFTGRRPADILVAMPTGPHQCGCLYNHLAARENVVKFSVDVDPRWVRKLLSRGEKAQVAAYIEHVLDQIEDVLSSQDIGLLVITPRLLDACSRRPRLADLINSKVDLVFWSGTHMSVDERFELGLVDFPGMKMLSSYSGAMILEGATERPGLTPDEEIIYDTRSPVVTFRVIDPATGDVVDHGERGRVVMTHLSKGMFLPNNLERDTAVRVAGPGGHFGDSVSAPQPVEVFAGETVIEGIY